MSDGNLLARAREARSTAGEAGASAAIVASTNRGIGKRIARATKCNAATGISRAIHHPNGVLVTDLGILQGLSRNRRIIPAQHLLLINSVQLRLLVLIKRA